MSIKLNKKWFIISFSIVLFSLISISLAQAGCVVIKVQYNDGCLRSNAIVRKISPSPIEILGTTNENGLVTSCGVLGPGTYQVDAWYSGSLFGPSNTLLYVNGDGDGSATITNSDNSYPNGTEICGDSECDGRQFCVGTPKYIECLHYPDNTTIWNQDCDTKKCCSCNGRNKADPRENYDETQDGDCPTCQICSDLNTCSNASSGTDPKNNCVGNCDNCDGNGNCAANETACESNYNCSSCTGSETNYTCTYDEIEDDDCNPFDIFGITTCDWIPDNYHFTWDFRSSFDSQCLGINNCSQGSTTITHTCNQTCGAYCDEDVDCSNECDDKKWYYNYWCNDSCNCQATNPICSVDHCGAECDGPEHCASGVCNLDDCTCFIDTTPPAVTILYPRNNDIYYSGSILVYLKVSINEATSWIGYSLDSKANVTLWTNKPVGTYDKYITVPNFGSHNIIIYANDTSGNMGKSNKVYFTTKLGGGGNICIIRGICLIAY